MIRRKNIVYTFSLALLVVLFLTSGNTGHTAGINLGTYPTPSEEAQTPVGLVNDFYNLALIVSGLLAFAVVVYAGIKYTISGGNASVQGDAKDQIKQAFLGLLLLLGAYIILNTINPRLTRLSIEGGSGTAQCPSGQTNPHRRVRSSDGLCATINSCGRSHPVCL